MARCEQGYLCAVCGREVEQITDSALYLRYVLGEVPPEQLHRLPERHLACDSELAQYIVAPEFPPVPCPGPFDKHGLDAEYVQTREALVTQAWQRLHTLPHAGVTLLDYPVTETSQDDNGSY